MIKANKTKKESKSFTTRIPLDTWKKIEQYRQYGDWKTNQLMNHALHAFFEIVESHSKNPEVPLICETVRDLCQRTRTRKK
ncbi:MAG: hypothetical protein CMI30_09165 [Opitutae bacterium]|nr:hypothetical protein [Opitutae bacterium]|tara:strand:+ start:14074 stop:14316 length:243 start_codon:yes stop_codon:yes gene_type:complete